MGRSAIEALGYSRDQAQRMTDAFADIDRKGMLSVAEHYDPAIPTLENEAYVASIRARASSWEAELTAKMEVIMSEVKV
tara:strand:- start:514 stop:750 length:237 start_codon:yes stop_codon:yes gene_type:complete